MQQKFETAAPLTALDEYFKALTALHIGLKFDQSFRIPEMPVHLRRLLLRSEETESTLRDQWDNWEHSFAENYLRHQLWEPEVDIWSKGIRDNMMKAGIEFAPLWPNNSPFAVCLTHDVDIMSHTMSPRQRWRELQRNLRAGDIEKGGSHVLQTLMKTAGKLLLRPAKSVPDAYLSLEKCIDIEKEFGASSSYFFTVYPLTRYSQYDCLYAFDDKFKFMGKPRTTADIMKGLIQDGSDVGLHGSYFSATVPGMLEEQKRALEKALGSPVTTTRQHWLHWKHPLTPRLQEKAGFLADTTLGYNRNIGFRAGTSLPFFIYDSEKSRTLSLIELPLIVQDGAVLGSNALEYPPDQGFSLIKPLIDKIKKVNGCATFLFHPDAFIKAGMDGLYRQIIAYCLEQGAWVSNLKEIQAWWRQRAVNLGWMR